MLGAVDQDQVRRELFRQAALWAVEQRSAEGVVRAACDALVAGVDGKHLAELAGLSVTVHRDAETVTIVSDALEEQGLPQLVIGSEDALVAATQVVAEEVLRGIRTPRAAAAWGHRVVGHEGPARLQTLVELDDRYDSVEYSTDDPEDLDGEVVVFCRWLISQP